MVRAIWNNQVVAESDETIVVEGNHYFPIAAVKKEFLLDSNTQTVCPWKGKANYYTLEVDGEQNFNAAWYYPAPSQAAAKIKGYVAFWHGVQVQV